MTAGCWANFGLRLLLLPVVAVKGILQLPYSYVEEEPSRSGAYGAKASLAAASGSAMNGKAHAASAAGWGLQEHFVRIDVASLVFSSGWQAD